MKPMCATAKVVGSLKDTMVTTITHILPFQMEVIVTVAESKGLKDSASALIILISKSKSLAKLLKKRENNS